MSPVDLARAALGAPETLRDDAGRSTDHHAARTAGLVLLGCLGAALFGAVVGSFRVDADSVDPTPLLGAVKVPVILLLSVLVVLPTVHRVTASAEVTWTQTAREGALALARTGLVLVALVPGVWIAWNLPISWDHALLVTVAAVLVALAVGLRGVHLGGPTVLGRAASTGLLLLVLGQVAWTIGPSSDAPRGLFFADLLRAIDGPSYAEAHDVHVLSGI